MSLAPHMPGRLAAGRWVVLARGLAGRGASVVPAAAAATIAGYALAALALAESVARCALTGAGAQAALSRGALALAATLPVAGLGAPAAAIAVLAANLLSVTLFHTLTVAGAIAQLVALHRLARQRSGRVGAPLALALSLVFLAPALARPVPDGSQAAVLAMLLASLGPATALAGMAARARAEAQRLRTARQAIAGDLLDFAARGERARIARELHDVVAHHISMIAVQSEAGRLTTPGNPVAAAQRFAAIGDTARAALMEMRRLLGVLREDAEIDSAERRPQPGIAHLNELLDEARAASAAGARLILSGRPVQLDPGVELAAYRIVQEALTNARRHAPGAGIDVELRYEQDRLRLHVRDNGPGPAGETSAGGHGLTGMRERAAAVGGELRSGPAAGGGFLVEATLPASAEETG